MFAPPQSIRWLFLDLNSYFASVEQQRDPSLRGKPVAVVPLETDATCAIAASYEAKAYGIKTGTPIYKAKRLCPDLHCIRADHSHYVDYHHRILAAIERHIPITEIASIDEVACLLDKKQQHPQTAIRLAHAIKEQIHHDVGEAIHCSIGFAPNAFLAKVATELQKPDGLALILPQDIPHKLLPLSFDDIPGLGRAMQARLQRLGIHDMAALYRLQPKQMRAIWHSVAGERLYYQLRGYELERQATQRRTVGHSHVLAPENRPEPQARLVCHRLILKAASRLRRLGFYCSAMQLSIRLEQGERLKSGKRFRPCCDNDSLTQNWSSLWHELRQQSRHATPPRIKKIAITLHELTAAEQLQPDLFDQLREEEGRHPTEVNPKRKEALARTMDALNQKYGRNTITVASTMGEANQVTGTKIAFSRIPEREEFKE